MFIRKFTTLLLLSFILIQGYSQNTCGGLGQTPGGAFPVCGTDTFKQTTVPACGGRTLVAPGCGNALSDLNPFWYRFTCYTAGSLGFLITPNNLNDDYDWQLFDITNHNADDVYADPSLFVACNWSGEKGVTGATDAGNSLVVCETPDANTYRNPFSTKPNIIEGHEYILLVSHFLGDDQSGYDLSFRGGTASITDPKLPALASARAICDGVKMTVKLNKKMKCSSLNADGSDFTVTPGVAPIIAAEGVNCINGFDMDSVVLTLASPIPPGNYTIAMKSDNSGINLLDNCNRSIPDGQSLPVTVYPLFPTPMDSLTKPGCAPDVLQLVFSKPMLCSSITTSGSEFTVSGPTPVSVIGAMGTCDESGLSNVINLKLSAPIQSGGTYRITLNVGTDGNTVFNECGKETPAGSFVDFYVADTVSAVFNYIIKWGCKVDTIDFTHDGRNGVNSWQWVFDGSITSSQKDTSIIYNVFGNKNATLTVSNGNCRQTYSVIDIFLDNELNAAFESTSDVCPGDPALFVDNSYNRVVGWNWDFGNGFTSTLKTPASQFYTASNNNVIRDVPVRLIVQNDLGCKDTAINIIHVVGNCYIAIPKAFTPNSDGLNDYLYPTNAYKARNLKFSVYNRGGQKIFETTNWTNKWDGTFKGQPQDPGTYVWTLVYTNIDTGQRFELKGSTILIR